MKQTLKIGTRGSRLALWQANWVKTALEKMDPLLSAELIVIKTKGDKILDTPLARVGGKGLFVKEIEDALSNGRIDLAVHSMKDMPAVIPPGLAVGCVPERESPKDVLISINNLGLAELKPGAIIGTSSLRRAAQLRALRPDIRIVALRGNLDTRIGKLNAQKMDAIVLAAAGVRRLNLADRISEYLDETVMLPAVGQGALCIEIRAADRRTAERIAPLNHPETRAAVRGERAFLNRLEGGCQVPIAAYGVIQADRLTLSGLVADLDGTRVIKNTLAGPVRHCRKIGIDLAEGLLARGAGEILQNLKNDMDQHETR